MIDLSELMDTKKIASALDIGSRMGEFTFRIKNALPEDSKIIGLDCCEETVAEANKKFSDSGVEFIVGNGSDLQFEDSSFDLVTLSNSLHHIDNYEKVLDEMMRVLCSGGVFLINEMFSDDQNPAQVTHYLQHTLEAKIDMLTGEYQRPVYKRSEIFEIIENLDLDNLHVLEFREDEESDKKLEKKTKKLVASIEKISDKPEYESLKAEAQMIYDRYLETGIERGTQMIVYGNKK